MAQSSRKCIILQGPPACGKSTIANTWQAENPESRVIVSRDALRHARGQYWIPEQEDFITELETSMIQAALDHGLDIIIDATNFNPAYLDRFQWLVSPFGYDIEYWMVHTRLAECLARDTNPDREHHVGETIIRSFYKKYHAYCHQHNIEMNPGTITKTIIKN